VIPYLAHGLIQLHIYTCDIQGYSLNAMIKIKIDNIAHTINPIGGLNVILKPGYHTIAIERIYQETNLVRYLFDKWNDNSTNLEKTINLNSDTYIGIYFKTQYYLQANSSYDIPISFLGTGWYDEYVTATLSIDKPLVTVGNTRYVFKYWIVERPGSWSSIGLGTSFSFDMIGPVKATAAWDRQFYVKVISAYSSTTGSGWYKEGSTAFFQIESESEPVEDWLRYLGVKYIFDGWTGDFVGKSPADSVVVNKPIIIVATWRIDYTNMYKNISIILVLTVMILTYTLRRRNRACY
jgi:hypothetical protein